MSEKRGRILKGLLGLGGILSFFHNTTLTLFASEDWVSQQAFLTLNRGIKLRKILSVFGLT